LAVRQALAEARGEANGIEGVFPGRIFSGKQPFQVVVVRHAVSEVFAGGRQVVRIKNQFVQRFALELLRVRLNGPVRQRVNEQAADGGNQENNGVGNHPKEHDVVDILF
jgi:hypothetical protein